MKYKKITVFLLVILISICLCVGILILRSHKQSDKYVRTAEEGDVTRYQWMEMLCRQSGLEEYRNSVPYYEDVNADNPYFSYIQSAVEWEVLDRDAKFEGDGYASGRFVVLTAMKTIGERKLMMYLGTEDTIEEDIYVKLAIEHDLIQQEQLAEGVSAEECEQILENLRDVYFGEFWRDDYSHVVYQDEVIELSPDEVLQSSLDGSEIVVSDNVRDTLGIGTIIVFEEKNTKLKFAREITKADTDGTLSLWPVELEQVVESLTVSDIEELTFEDIANYYGTKEDIYALDDLKFQQSDERFMDAAVFSEEVHSEGYKITLSTKEKDNDKYLEVQMKDNATETSIVLPVNEKVQSDSEYSVEIDIDKILIGGQIEYSFWNKGLEYVEVGVDVDSTFKGVIEAEEEKKIPLWKTPVPLGNGLMGVDVQIYLVLSMEGMVSFAAELPLEVSLYYEKDKGLRKYEHEILFKDPKIEANCDAGAMLRFEPVLSLVGCLNVIDAEADIGMTASAKVITRPNSQICAETKISFPIIALGVCGDDDADTLFGNVMGLSAKWEIISSDDAPVHLKTHFEILPDKTAQFVEKCTYKEEGKEDKKKDKRVKVNGKENMQMGNTYYTRYQEITGIDSPVFCFDYPESWHVSMEEINATEYGMFGEYAKEVVELANERGVVVTFVKIDDEIFDLVDRNHFYSSYSAEKIAEIGSMMLGEEASDSFAVVKLTCDERIIMGVGEMESGDISYALMQESTLDELGYFLSADGPLGFEEAISFHYPTPYVFYANAPDGQFTKEEEKEVIAILSSFREAP